LNPSQLTDPAECGPHKAAVIEKAATHLAAGRCVVLYSALRPADCQQTADRRVLATETGKVLRELIRRSAVRRVVIAGGDTASQAVRELGITALTFLAPLAPGAPLCLAHSEEAGLAGLELVLKGGQVGAETFFEDVLRGY
jgi:uncharacterized protein YgbK (DUF1537 family)